MLRNLIVIGEAARYVPAAVAARYTDLPLIDIRGMRNFLVHVHQYDTLDTDIVWDTVQRDIDRPVVTLTTILELEP